MNCQGYNLVLQACRRASQWLGLNNIFGVVKRYPRVILHGFLQHLICQGFLQQQMESCFGGEVSHGCFLVFRWPCAVELLTHLPLSSVRKDPFRSRTEPVTGSRAADPAGCGDGQHRGLSPGGRGGHRADGRGGSKAISQDPLEGLDQLRLPKRGTFWGLKSPLTWSTVLFTFEKRLVKRPPFRGRPPRAVSGRPRTARWAHPVEETDHWAAALGLLREAHVEAAETAIGWGDRGNDWWMGVTQRCRRSEGPPFFCSDSQGD